MKAVINVCYGGFGGVSLTFVERAKELGWKTTDYNEEGNYTNPKAQIILRKKYDEARLIEQNVSRTDHILVKLVEELGEKANGDCSEYKVVELPDDIDYEVEEYDGNEWISETHRTWR